MTSDMSPVTPGRCALLAPIACRVCDHFNVRAESCEHERVAQRSHLGGTIGVLALVVYRECRGEWPKP